jgi:hypothetical protein
VFFKGFAIKGKKFGNSAALSTLRDWGWQGAVMSFGRKGIPVICNIKLK